MQSGQTVGQRVMFNPGDRGVIEPGGVVNGGAGDAVIMLQTSQALSNGGLVTTTGIDADGIVSLDDNAWIAHSGAVTTTGDDSDGIVSLGDNAWIGSSGTINTAGDNALGISSLGDSVSIDHIGAISTVGNDADGIFAVGDDARIGNSGVISTTGDDAEGIFSLGDDARIGNSGTISTTGDEASGISALADDARINNSGTISTSGFRGFGIGSGGANSRIENSGAISTSGSEADGILSSGSDNRVDNSGSIHVAGPNARGIRSSGANGQVINSGRIVSEQSNAIEFSGAQDNVLTLLSGSVIEGGLAFGGGTDTLIIGNGLSIAMTFDKAPERLAANGAPFAVQGSQVAVVDPTMLSTQEEALIDLTGGISSTVLGRLGSLRNGGVSGVTANPPMYTAGAGDGGLATAGPEYWIQGFGSHRDQAGERPSLDTDQYVAGIVSGFDAAYSYRSRAGVFLGGSWGEVEHALGTQETNIDSFYGGVYLSTLRGRTAFDFILTGGWSDYEQERIVANNLAAGGLQIATADYDGWFASPELTITRPFWPFGKRIEKSLTLRYAGLFLDGFSESGAADAFTVHDRDVHLGVARGALTLPFVRQGDDGAFSRLALTGGVEGRRQFGDTDFSGALLGQDIVFDPGGDESVVAGFAGITGEHTMPGGLTAFVSLEGKLEDADSHQVSAWGGVRFRF